MSFYFGNSKECPLLFCLLYYVVGVLIIINFPKHYAVFVFMPFYAFLFFLFAVICRSKSLKIAAFAFLCIWSGIYITGKKLSVTESVRIDKDVPYRVEGFLKRDPRETRSGSVLYLEIEKVLNSEDAEEGLSKRIVKLIVPERGINLARGQKVSALLFIKNKLFRSKKLSRYSLIPTLLSYVKSSVEIHALDNPSRLWIYPFRIKREVKNDISLLPLQSRAVLKGLLLGDKSELSGDLKKTFKTCGLLHMLVVSGFHIGVVFAFFFLLMKWFFKRFSILLVNFDVTLLASLGALFPSAIYSYMVGLPYPTLRATAMLFVGIVCLLSRRTIIAMNIFVLALLGITLFDPLSLFSVSFQLSTAAVFGILYGISRIRSLYASADKIKRGILKKVFLYLSDLFTVSVLAIAFTFPLSVYYFGYTSSISLIVNIIFVPVFSMVIFPLGIIGMLASIFQIAGSELIWQLNSSIIVRVVNLLSSFASSPHALIEMKGFHVGHVIMYYFLFVIMLSFKITEKKNKDLTPV